MNLPQRLRLMPLLIMVAGLALIVRAGEFASGMKQAGMAFAQQEVEAETPPMPGDTVPAAPAETAEPASAATAEGDGAQTPGVPAMPENEGGEEVEWKDAGDSEFVYSPVREELYKDLAERRRELEQREKALSTREALLEAAERELDQKVREMTAVRNEIESLLQQQSQQEEARVASLVKIYEGMKAKDAARIFNTLDTDVLLSVMTRMSERKTAPVLAEMNPDRARSITILMAQQKQIPEIPPQ